MRLDDFDPNINVEDQRGQGGGFGGFGGGGGGGLLFGLLPLIGSRFGCGGVVVVLILFAVFGGGLGNILGSGQQVAPTGGQVATRQGGSNVQESCTLTPESRVTCNAFSSADNTWQQLFARSGQRFQSPKLVFFSGTGRSGCGVAQAAAGPFYCPPDQGIYIDTSFFQELSGRFGAGGDFAQNYVIAHEFGHHIQTLLGTSEQVSRAQARASTAEGNALSVRLELQADCYAGVWGAANRARLDPGDVEEGLTAANAIGDDTLQRQGQGRVVPDSFTHGSAAQRQKWLRVGLETGDPAQCDTFSGAV